MFNAMAIFRRANTPMNPDREERRRQREAASYEALGAAQLRAINPARATGRSTRDLLNELSAMTFTDEASNFTPTQLRQMMELMNYGSSIRRAPGRRRGHSGGYDLVHKSD